MSNIEVTYESLNLRYPKEVASVLKKISSGSGKLKNTLPNTWKWTIRWGTTCESFTLADIVSGKGRHTSTMTKQEKIEDQISRSTPVWILAEVGKAWAVCILPDIPDDVKIFIANQY